GSGPGGQDSGGGSGPGGQDSGGGSGAGGESQSATVTIGSEGGVLSIGGATLTVPAGALNQDTEIRVLLGSPPPGADTTGLLGMSYDFSPDGTVFDPPAELELPVDGTIDN